MYQPKQKHMETCDHNFPLEPMYGFAHSSGWKGVGVCWHCPECSEVLRFDDDRECMSETEIAHNKEKRNKMNAMLGFGPQEDPYEDSTDNAQPQGNL